ncbi:MAG: FG-GAP-like repeat-containing protein, partial [Planctomycetia bacterium]|nr:FG-GAP-like repeat-containing protein [Planctomycetia bacterium]
MAGCGGCNRNQPAAPPAVKPPVVAPAEFKLTPELVAEHNVGVGHMGKFEFAPAQAIFADLAKRYPGWADVKVDLAIATFNQQKPDESFASQYIVDSLAILDDVLKIEPKHLRARYCQGVLLYYLGKTDEAKAHFEFVAAKDPADAFATYFVGRCQFNEGQFDEALAHYQQAIDRDPYFASAYYAAFQTLQRLRKPDEAKAMMADFQKLEGNPQARKEAMKYTRMGAKADVVVASLPEDKAATANVEFVEATQRFAPPSGFTWREPRDQRQPEPSLTCCDVNGDGRLDLFLAAGLIEDDQLLNAVFLQQSDGKLSLSAEHSLTKVTDASAVAWGDYDNDGLTDAYFGRRGANQLWRQTAQNQWEDVTDSTGTSAGNVFTADTMMIDFDHDGDLDLVIFHEDSSKTLLANNLDGTFRALGEESGFKLGRLEFGAHQIVATDFDHDRDVDLMFLGKYFANPNVEQRQAYANDRLWKFSNAKGLDRFITRGYPYDVALALDSDSDGSTEFYSLGAGLERWTHADNGAWEPKYLGPVIINSALADLSRMAAADIDGDGQWEVAICKSSTIVVRELRGSKELFRAKTNWPDAVRFAALDSVRTSLVWFSHDDKELVLSTKTPKNVPFIGLTFSGKEEKQDEMRSNRSGIGVKVNARIGSKWFSAETFRNDSGPGQSLMPLTFGTAGADKVDFVMLHWSDGVFQTETNLEAGKLHRIEETQRQTSSCPLLFVWDG